MFWLSVLLTSVLVCVAGLLLPLPSWISVLVGLATFGAVAWSSKEAEHRLIAGCGETGALTDSYPRLENLVDSLCLTTGTSPPEIRVLRSPARNIAAVGRLPHKSTLVITTGLLESTSRVELEAALANRIAQIANHRVALISTTLSTFCLALGSSRFRVQPFLLLDLLTRGRLTTDLERSNDFSGDSAGVVVTRYPPGMIEALEVLENQHHLPEVDPITAPLWLVDPSNAAERPSIQARIASLREM
jgi:Zn-dependent protease with chaperone function